MTKTTATDWAGCLAYLLLLAVGFFAICITLALHSVSWLVDQFLLIFGIYSPPLTWVTITAVGAIAVGVPAAPLAIFVKTPRLRAIYQTWALCAALVAVLSLGRSFFVLDLQASALVQIALLWLGIGALLRFGRKIDAGPGKSAVWAALLAVPLVSAPFVVFGALGSLTDTLLTGLTGASFGILVGLLLSRVLLRPFADEPSKLALLLAGFAAGVALTILAAGLGLAGSHLLLLFVLPTLGLAIAALGRSESTQKGRAIALLVGSGAAATLMFFDPAELALLLSLSTEGETWHWAMLAAILSLAGGLVAIVMTAALLQPRHVPTPLRITGVAATWGALILLYAMAGKPGLYGDQFLVILKDQADVSAARQMANRDERLRYVYTTLTRKAEETQAPLREMLDRYGITYRPYYLVNSIQVDGGLGLRAFFALQPQVDRVIVTPRLRPLHEPLPVGRGEQPTPQETLWNIQMIDADRVWKELGSTGRGIVVGQSDTGVDGTHPAISAQYRGSTAGDDYNWLDPWNGTRSPTDVGGHGTHTLGTILGRGGIGVAPDAEWFGCSNLARNLGNAALYLDCLQFMLAPYPQNGNPLKDGDPARAAHVINNSWGCPPLEGCDPDALQPAVHALRLAGIFVVASAGNNGPFCQSLKEPPAIYADALAVGAIDSAGSLAVFSSRGPVTSDGSWRVKPDITAPGEEIVSSFPQGTYYKASGTSMAGPHVVGVVALMWSANPKLIGDIERTEEILRTTARPYSGRRDPCGGSGKPDNATGYGIVDAYAAVQAAIKSGPF